MQSVPLGTVVRHRLDDATSNADAKQCIGAKTDRALALLFLTKDLQSILQAVVAIGTSGTKQRAIYFISLN